MKRFLILILLCLCATETHACCSCKRAEKELVAAMFRHGQELVVWEKDVAILDPDIKAFSESKGWLVVPTSMDVEKAIAQVEQACAEKKKRKGWFSWKPRLR